MKRLSQAIVAAATSLCALQAGATLVISYPDFSSVAGLTLNGNAAQAGNRLRVTPATFNQAGSAFSTNTVSLASNASFSTYFQFQFTSPGGACDGIGCGADGLVFVVQTVSNNVGGIGGGIGYDGIANSVGIEFDTYLEQRQH
jgi:Bacterial lectin